MKYTVADFSKVLSLLANGKAVQFKAHPVFADWRTVKPEVALSIVEYGINGRDGTQRPDMFREEPVYTFKYRNWYIFGPSTTSHPTLADAQKGSTLGKERHDQWVCTIEEKYTNDSRIPEIRVVERRVE